MRHPHYKLLPHRERTRRRVPANYLAVYLQARHRGRASRFTAPPDIAGLKLWLDAALGLTGAWVAAPDSGSVWADYSTSSNYPANGSTHAIRIYPFKTVDGDRVYSAGFLELTFTDDNSAQTYLLNWSWSAVGDAEGYRVLKRDTYSGTNFDFYRDVIGAENFVDTSAGEFTGGASVTPLASGPAGAGDPVTQWNDLSGLSNHAATVNAVASATLQSGIVNGRPVLRFGSASGYTTPLALNTPCTVFAVYALNGAGDNARRAVQGSNNWLIGPYGPPHEFFNGVGFSGGPALTRGVFVAQASWQDGSALGAGGGPAPSRLALAAHTPKDSTAILPRSSLTIPPSAPPTWRTCGATSRSNINFPDAWL